MTNQLFKNCWTMSHSIFWTHTPNIGWLNVRWVIFYGVLLSLVKLFSKEVLGGCRKTTMNCLIGENFGIHFSPFLTTKLEISHCEPKIYVPTCKKYSWILFKPIKFWICSTYFSTESIKITIQRWTSFIYDPIFIITDVYYVCVQ